MAEQVAFEVVHALDAGEILFARVSRGLDDVFGVQGAGFGAAVFLGAFELDGPFAGRVGPGGRDDFGFHPDVEFEGAGVGFEPVAEFVFRGKNGPVGWEGEVRQVVVPDWVVEDFWLR